MTRRIRTFVALAALLGASRSVLGSSEELPCIAAPEEAQAPAAEEAAVLAVIDFRLYRAGFLPALVAVVVLLFSLQVPPPSLDPVVAPVEFDEAAAVRLARQIVTEAPDRQPGSAGDAAIADLVEKRFSGIADAQVRP